MRWLEAGAVAALCVALAGLAAAHAARTSPTFDEPAHIVAGYTYARQGDFRINPEHPPLVKRLAALPLLGLGPWPATFDLADPATIGGPGTRTLELARRSWDRALVTTDAQWPLAHALLYGLSDSALARRGARDAFDVDPAIPLAPGDFLDDPSRLVFRARLVVVALAVALALAAWAWSRELFGAAGGLTTLALCAFDPGILAHGSLVTTDVGAALAILGASYSLWRVHRRMTVASVATAALAFGIAAATKFSCIVLAPATLALAFYAVLRREPDVPRRRRLVRWAIVGAAVTIGAYAGVWAAYDFRFSAVAPTGSSPPRALRVERAVLDGAATRAAFEVYPDGPPPAALEEARRAASLTVGDRLILSAERHRLLPEAYLYGLAHARRKAMARRSFLRGEHSVRGFRSYFAWTFALKTPLPVLAALLATAVLLVRRRALRGPPLVFLAVPFALYLALTLASNLNIGHRHLLPLYPLAYVGCGALAGVLDGRSCRMRATALAAFGALLALGSSIVFTPPWRPTLVYPHYLTYFNELAGGPRNGHRALVDSNLDWGQALPDLARWLAERDVREPIGLCYFGQADPRFYGFAHVKLPGGYLFEPPHGDASSFDALPRLRYVAISATSRAGVYMRPPLRDAWAEYLRGAELVGLVGHAIFVYRLPDRAA